MEASSLIMETQDNWMQREQSLNMVLVNTLNQAQNVRISSPILHHDKRYLAGYETDNSDQNKTILYYEWRRLVIRCAEQIVSSRLQIEQAEKPISGITTPQDDILQIEFLNDLCEIWHNTNDTIRP